LLTRINDYRKPTFFGKSPATLTGCLKRKPQAISSLVSLACPSRSFIATVPHSYCTGTELTLVWVIFEMTFIECTYDNNSVQKYLLIIRPEYYWVTGNVPHRRNVPETVDETVDITRSHLRIFSCFVGLRPRTTTRAQNRNLLLFTQHHGKSTNGLSSYCNYTDGINKWVLLVGTLSTDAKKIMWTRAFHPQAMDWESGASRALVSKRERRRDPVSAKKKTASEADFGWFRWFRSYLPYSKSEDDVSYSDSRIMKHRPTDITPSTLNLSIACGFPCRLCTISRVNYNISVWLRIPKLSQNFYGYFFRIYYSLNVSRCALGLALNWATDSTSFMTRRHFSSRNCGVITETLMLGRPAVFLSMALFAVLAIVLLVARKICQITVLFIFSYQDYWLGRPLKATAADCW
jgi:hypothetical protein